MSLKLNIFNREALRKKISNVSFEEDKRLIWYVIIEASRWSFVDTDGTNALLQVMCSYYLHINFFAVIINILFAY